MQYDLSYAGAQLRDTLSEEVQERSEEPVTPFIDRHQLNAMRRLWVLDQYLKGRRESMTGPIMGPVFQRLLEEGAIEEAR